MRKRLGIPLDAKHVLIFGESSHWDTNWLQTSEEYFTLRIEPIFEAVLAALTHDPARVYCIESVFFLKLYWERHPHRRSELRDLFARGQLRMLASSYTTPDTLLPHHESILRDFQLGHEWLLENGLPPAPATAYFPDNFGHSPHLPSLMQSVGVRGVGLTRIDGMYFIACDYRSRDHFPRPGSTAELLEKVHRSHDFVWRDDDGAEILCHWNAHTYFQGDMLAHAGIIRWAGKVFALPWRTSSHIARRINRYVRDLSAWAKTPYLFCPIGMDFNDPIADLGALLARYNKEHYPRTGTWTLSAGLDDYFALIDCQRSALPVLQADPNPYWMGFLATRPEVKQRSVRIARTLLLAEKLSAAQPPHQELERALHDGWTTLVLTNHHDYIPGTSPDRVWEEEQRPWLDKAEAEARNALTLAAEPISHEHAPCPGVQVRDQGEQIEIATPHYKLTLSRAKGGCITSFRAAGHEWLKGLGFDLIAFHDEGGLWRLGHEFKGGRFAERERASMTPAEISLDESAAGLFVTVVSNLCGQRFERQLICRGDQPFVRLRVQGVAPRRVTVTMRFATALDPPLLEMDTVGGVISRPRERLYSPTYWPVPSRLTLRDAHVEADNSELTVLFESPSAASLSEHGALDWIVARNANKERAFGFLPVLAHPIGGTNSDVQIHESALFVARSPERAREVLTQARQTLERSWMLTPLEQNAAHAVRSLVRCDTAGVNVMAVKRPHAARWDAAGSLRGAATWREPSAEPSKDPGQGLIVRLYCEHVPTVPVRVFLPGVQIQSAAECDALEQVLAPLKVEAPNSVVLRLAQRSTSLLLRTR